MKKCQSLCFIFVFTLAVFPGIECEPRYRSRIPNGFGVPGNQGVGHVSDAGGGPLNAFGELFKQEGYRWTLDLCNADSDGDGFSNGVELGDPYCTWKEDGTGTVASPVLSDPTKATSWPGDNLLDQHNLDPANRWLDLEQDLLCDVLVIGAGLAGMTAAAKAADRGFQVCVVSSDTPESSTSAASSGTMYLPLEGPFPQSEPLEFFEHERKEAFLGAVEKASTFLERSTGAVLRPVLPSYPTYFDELTDRVQVLTDAHSQIGFLCGGQLSMAETLERLHRLDILYVKATVQNVYLLDSAIRTANIQFETTTSSNRKIRSRQVILASGGYAAVRNDFAWKGALASGNDGLNLRVAASVGAATTKLEEAWFTEMGEGGTRWFLWEENATAVDAQFNLIPHYNPYDAYDARGRARRAVNATEDIYLLSNPNSSCFTSPNLLSWEEPLIFPAPSAEEATCGPSAQLWYDFLTCYGCDSKAVPCGSRLNDTTMYRSDTLQLWSIDSNGGPVVDECNQFESVEGLFAVGNAAPPMLGHAYLAPGSTLGNALVSAYVAASCIPEKPEVDTTSDPLKWPAWLIFHVTGMSIAWGGLFIFGHSRLLRKKRKPRHYEVHKWVMLFALTLAFAAAITVLVKGDFNYVYERGYAHPLLGILTLIVICLQPLFMLKCTHCAKTHRYSGKFIVPIFLLLTFWSGLYVAIELWYIPPLLHLLVVAAIIFLFCWFAYSVIYFTCYEEF